MLLPNPLNPYDSLDRFIALQKARSAKHPHRPKQFEPALIAIDREVIEQAGRLRSLGPRYALTANNVIASLNRVRRSLLGIAPLAERSRRWSIAA